MLDKIAYAVVSDPREIPLADRRAFAAGFAKRAAALGMRAESVAMFVKAAQAVDPFGHAPGSPDGTVSAANSMPIGGGSPTDTAARLRYKQVMEQKLRQSLTGADTAQVMASDDPEWVVLSVLDPTKTPGSPDSYSTFRIKTPNNPASLAAGLGDAVELIATAQDAAADSRHTNRFVRAAARVTRKADAYVSGTSRYNIWGTKRDDNTYIERNRKRLELDKYSPAEALLAPEDRRGLFGSDAVPAVLRSGRGGAGPDSGGTWIPSSTNMSLYANGYRGRRDNGWVHDALIRYRNEAGDDTTAALPEGFAMAQPERSADRRGWDAVIVNTRTGEKTYAPWDDKGRQIDTIRRLSGKADFAPGFKPQAPAPDAAKTPAAYTPAGGGALHGKPGVSLVRPPLLTAIRAGRAGTPLGAASRLRAGSTTQRVVKAPAAPAAAVPQAAAPARPEFKTTYSVPRPELSGKLPVNA